MTTIRVTVPDPVYRCFQAQARAQGRSMPEVIRQALEEYRQKHVGSGSSVLEIQPVSVGKVIRPLSRRDDLLREMLDANGD